MYGAALALAVVVVSPEKPKAVLHAEPRAISPALACDSRTRLGNQINLNRVTVAGMVAGRR